MSQAYGFAAKGGLNTNLNSLELLGNPGFAVRLSNFEVDPDGGYRRINGFTAYGGASATRPNTTNRVLGTFAYADGIIVCSGTDMFFSNDGITWLKINRSGVAGGGDNYTTFTGRSTLTRTNQGQCQFALFEGATYKYGQVIIADGANKLYSFRMEGTGALNTRTFFAEEITVNGTNSVKYITVHDHHLVAAGVDNNLNTVYYSVDNNPTNFTGTGAGAVTISDQIQGIKGFRTDLIVFTRNSIHKLININDSQTVRIDPIAENVGCLSGYSIQEIGGDLVFLAPDGIRTVAGTARIGDTELSSVSRQIQSIIREVNQNITDYVIDSCVIREKSQYRLFYSGPNETIANALGIIGTFTGQGFEWSETQGIQAFGLSSTINYNGLEKVYHGDKDGYIYNHDTGTSFLSGGTEQNITAIYETADLDFGDIGTRKTLKYVRTSFSPEGEITPTLRLRYDYKSTDILQPSDITITGIPLPAIFGEAVFGTATFGGTNDPMVRTTVQGSGNTVSLRIRTDDKNFPYAVNGFYLDYMPSGRR
jgi:hypothetical protein